MEIGNIIIQIIEIVGNQIQEQSLQLQTFFGLAKRKNLKNLNNILDI